jgi:hypothetical protein
MYGYFTARNAAVAISGTFLVGLALSGTAKAITDSVFKYSTAKTGYYSLDPNAFAPQSSTTTFFIGDVPDSLYDTSGASRCFATGVNLPDGAKITALSAWYSSDTQGNVSAWLGRNKLGNGSFEYVAQLTSTNTSKTRRKMNAAIPGSAIATVDNANYSYHTGVCFGSSGADSRFYGGRIAFSYTNAGD